MRKYLYVGPSEIVARVAPGSMGFAIHDADDVRQWAMSTRQSPDRSGGITATFVIDEQSVLRIADRRSEHVSCAGGRPVLSAGEITFEISPHDVLVTDVTNQSTGYCPEPSSWPAVATALECAGLDSLEGFTLAYDFRRCTQCGSKNLIKNGIFECDVCGRELPRAWNFDSTPDAPSA